MTEHTLKLLGKPANDMEKGILEYITPMIFMPQENVIEHKKLTLRGCVEYCMKKGKQFEIKSGNFGFAPISPEQHFAWVREYFGLDDTGTLPKAIPMPTAQPVAAAPALNINLDDLFD